MSHSASPSPVRVALIGYGYAGRVFHAPLLTTTPGLSLRVIGSSRPDAAACYEGASVTADARAAAAHPEVELVVIATPNHTHVELATAALRAGKHVVVDKPFTVTHAEARALAALARAQKRVLSVFQNRRWDSDFLALREQLARGAVGEVSELRAEWSRHRPEVRDRWREREGAGAGLYYDLGPHLIDQALVLFGLPDALQLELARQRPGARTDDWFQLLLRYGRCRVLLSASSLAADETAHSLLRGRNGTLSKRRSDPQEAALVRGARPGSAGWGEDPEPLILQRKGEPAVAIVSPPGDYGRYYAGVRDAIVSGAAPPVTADQACALMAVLEAGLRSAESGRFITPELDERERSAFVPG